MAHGADPGSSADSDAEEQLITEALETANLNALRMALYQLTQDPALASMRVIEGGASRNLTCHVLAPEHHPEVIEKARTFLKRPRTHVPPPPSEIETRRLIELFRGGPMPDAAAEISIEELGLKEFPRGCEWNTKPPQSVLSSYHVIIVGAGFSGIATAIQLKRLGIPYTLIEREEGYGGTWYINDYPEARVDVDSHDYQFSFEKNYPWKHFYATQPELKRYMEHCASKYGIASHTRFNTEMVQATWDEGSAQWIARIRGTLGGREEALRANVIVTAVGAFIQPKLPDISGIGTFRGPIFHTTEWDHAFDPTGKAVGMIGNGSSGAQVMPAIARQATHLTVFQRTPAWVMSIDNYRAPIPESMRLLFDRVPLYWNWYCFANFLPWLSDMTGMHSYDRGWQREGGFVSSRNDAIRNELTEHIKTKFVDRPDLIAKLTPKYAPWAKRPVIDNGFYDALKRPNVALVTEPIKEITSSGIVTEDGVQHHLDAIILASGFDITRYMSPIQFVGRNGINMDDLWKKDGSRSYLGLTIPQMPNLFMMFGPNAAMKAAAATTWIECWVRYAVESIIMMIEKGYRSMECRRDAYEEYNARLDAAARNFIWEGEGIVTYFLNEHKRSIFMVPWDPVDYYSWIHHPNPDDYVFTRSEPNPLKPSRAAG
jgi:4-hydroxyacetophenone monooxygenase